MRGWDRKFSPDDHLFGVRVMTYGDPANVFYPILTQIMDSFSYSPSFFIQSTELFEQRACVEYFLVSHPGYDAKHRCALIK